MKEQFIETKFQKKMLVFIEQINTLLNEYQARGYDLSVRQVYYCFISRGMIEKGSNNAVQKATNKGRKAGLINWSQIVYLSQYTLMPRAGETPLIFFKPLSIVLELTSRNIKKTTLKLWLRNKPLRACLLPFVKG